ncbi:MAG: CaiB/BaiF CoA transferase family protein [Acidimicrobiales bacterium]
MQEARGPLRGMRVLEVAGLGAGPFCAMVLADMGADVVRVDRPSSGTGTGVLGRGKRSITVDLKSAGGVDLLLRLVGAADVVVEAFRPGVAERLGFGPAACLARNPRLVYARATGWGQDGPWSSMAGHDIDYIALSGVLSMIGPSGGPPVPPLNLLGDFGGGGLALAFGVTCALIEAARSGWGQVVDGAMVDGSALLATLIYELVAMGGWREERGANALDGGAPYYATYETADGRWLAIGAVEPQFYRRLLEGLGLAGAPLPEQGDRARWPELRDAIAAAVRRRTRDEWEREFAGTDACVAPVLTPSEVAGHPQHAARGTFVDVGGVRQPAPAPRLSRTPGGVRGPAPVPGADTDAVLPEWGIDGATIAACRRSGALG